MILRTWSVTRTPRPLRTRSIAPPRPSSGRGGAHLPANPPPASGREVGSRPADLVFGPTLACGGDHGPNGRLAPSPGPGRARPGQGLHLNRTMLDDQQSPYVGRFA